VNRFGWVLAAVFVGLIGLTIWSVSRETGVSSASSSAQALPTNLVAPVTGVAPTDLTDSWNDPREGGMRGHRAIDIPAPRGTPVVAAFAGEVSKLFTSDAGGITVYVRNGEWQAYYAHLDGYAPGLAEGQRVATGQHIGFVGDSGNADAGNTHLHFALHRMAPGDRWWQGTPVNAYPILAGKKVAD
jgi:peptidoglycan LD-endopeptidase LytH